MCHPVRRQLYWVLRMQSTNCVFNFMIGVSLQLRQRADTECIHSFVMMLFFKYIVITIFIFIPLLHFQCLDSLHYIQGDQGLSSHLFLIYELLSASANLVFPGLYLRTVRDMDLIGILSTCAFYLCR